MRISLDCVVDLDFTDASPGRGILTLNISQPPVFFWRRDIPSSNGVPPSCWKACNDWTENKAATHSLRHMLEGPARPLAYIAGYIKDRIFNPVSRQYPSPPMIKCPPSSALAHPALGSDQNPNCFPSARCRPGTPEWNTTSCPEDRHSDEPKFSLSSYSNHTAPSLPGPFVLHGLPSFQSCDERTRLSGIGAMSGSTSNSLPSLIPQKLLHSSAQAPNNNRQLSPLLPGLSELFSSTHYSQ